MCVTCVNLIKFNFRQRAKFRTWLVFCETVSFIRDLDQANPNVVNNLVQPLIMRIGTRKFMVNIRPVLSVACRAATLCRFEQHGKRC